MTILEKIEDFLNEGKSSIYDKPANEIYRHFVEDGDGYYDIKKKLNDAKSKAKNNPLRMKNILGALRLCDTGHGDIEKHTITIKKDGKKYNVHDTHTNEKTQHDTKYDAEGEAEYRAGYISDKGHQVSIKRK